MLSPSLIWKTEPSIGVGGRCVCVFVHSAAKCIISCHLQLIWRQSYLQFSCSAGFDSLWPHGLQHTRPSCPSPTPRDCSNSVHWVSDAIQPSHPLSPPSPPTLNFSQHEGLFKWVSPSHQVAKVWEFQLQHQSFQWIFRTDFLWDGLIWSPCSRRDSQESYLILQLFSAFGKSF